MRRAFLVTGRVQGVGFRWHVAQEARRLGVSGAVWNRPDGGVEVHARASREALLRLEAWLRKGPPAARVEGLEELTPGPAADGEGFRVRF